MQQAESKKQKSSYSKWVLPVLKKAVNSVLVVSAIWMFSQFFSMLSSIHVNETAEDYFSSGYPSIIGLLDSEFFMGLIFVITLMVIGYVLYLLWQVHEVAVHKANSMSSAHTQIVFALSLCGLFIDKAWWVLAIMIAFGRWDILGDKVSSIISKGVRGDKS